MLSPQNLNNPAAWYLAMSAPDMLHMQLCKGCFFSALEEEVHQTIVTHRLFSPGERVAVAASGVRLRQAASHACCARCAVSCAAPPCKDAPTSG